MIPTWAEITRNDPFRLGFLRKRWPSQSEKLAVFLTENGRKSPAETKRLLIEMAIESREDFEFARAVFYRLDGLRNA